MGDASTETKHSHEYSILHLASQASYAHPKQQMAGHGRLNLASVCITMASYTTNESAFATCYLKVR